MGTISKTVQHRIDSFRQKQMMLGELTKPGWGNVADYFCERDMTSGLTELKVRAVVQPETTRYVATPSPTAFGEHMYAVNIVPRQSQMPQVTS
jgi:hypothetical protein